MEEGFKAKIRNEGKERQIGPEGSARIGLEPATPNIQISNPQPA